MDNFLNINYEKHCNEAQNVLEQSLAKLDNAKYGVVFASGLSTTTAILSLLNSGDHIILSNDVYGGLHKLLRHVRLGIIPQFVDVSNVENLTKLIEENNTKMVWIETPTNPLMKVVDIKLISDAIRKCSDCIIVVDNTFLTPYFQRPLDFGADIVLCSISKYINGHSDIVMGSVVLNKDNLYEKIRFLQEATGNIPSSFDCSQVSISIKTLALRMEQHSKSALEVAKLLETHPNVVKVFHPRLPSHPQYQISLKQCSGHSGILSFYIKGELEEAKRFLKSLKIFTISHSLGGFESLAELPSVMTHAFVPQNERISLGLTDNLIRLSIGLEDTEDIINDLKQALDKI